MKAMKGRGTTQNANTSTNLSSLSTKRSSTLRAEHQIEIDLSDDYKENLRKFIYLLAVHTKELKKVEEVLNDDQALDNEVVHGGDDSDNDHGKPSTDQQSGQNNDQLIARRRNAN